MKKLSLFFSIFLISILSVAWTIKESKQDEDVQIIVNDGGTFKEAIKVEGSNASVILGPVGGGAEQVIAHDAYFGNTSRVRLQRQSDYFGLTLINDGGDTKFDLVSAEVGNAYMTGTVDGDMIMGWAGNLHFTPDRGSTKVGSITSTGLWTFNSATDGANTASVINSTATASANDTLLRLRYSGDTDTTGAFYITFEDSDSTPGSISATGVNTIVYTATSDARLKQNIQPMKGGLDRLMKLEPSTFEWKKDGSKDEGFIAQNVKAVYPSAVAGTEDGDRPMSVDYGRVTPLMVAAIKEQQEMIKDLYDRLAKTQGSLAQANHRIEELENAQ